MCCVFATKSKSRANSETVNFVHILYILSCGFYNETFDRSCVVFVLSESIYALIGQWLNDAFNEIALTQDMQMEYQIG